MAGAPVPGGQRGSMKFEGLQVPDKPALVAENGQAFMPVQAPVMPTQQVTMQHAQPMMMTASGQRVNELFPELPATEGRDLICTVALMQGGVHRFMEPFYASATEWPILRDYIREWAQANRVDALFEFPADASECSYLVPRTLTSREELQRKLDAAREGTGLSSQKEQTTPKRIRTKAKPV